MFSKLHSGVVALLFQKASVSPSPARILLSSLCFDPSIPLKFSYFLSSSVPLLFFLFVCLSVCSFASQCCFIFILRFFFSRSSNAYCQELSARLCALFLRLFVSVSVRIRGQSDPWWINVEFGTRAKIRVNLVYDTACVCDARWSKLTRPKLVE